MINIANGPPCSNLSQAGPEVSFYLADTATPVGRGHPLWRALLPGRRTASPQEVDPAARGHDTPNVTYGVYFEAVAAFVTGDHCAVLRRAAAQTGGLQAEPGAVRRIRIHLEKHGAFYHPARVAADLRHGRVQLAVNVAASPQGRALVAREYELLKTLNRRVPGILPEIYAYTAGAPPAHLPMLAGQWLTDYHEFHSSRNPADQSLQFRVWQAPAPDAVLGSSQIRELFSGIGAILTGFYDVRACTHITGWHHAAGDFVIAPAAAPVRVRLVTVRDYRPIVRLDAAADDVARSLQGLLLFLSHLSLQIRLDRLDGTGDLIWLPEYVLEAALAGFQATLAARATPEFLPAPLPICLALFLKQCDGATLRELLDALMAGDFYHPDEVKLIQQHAAAHVAALHSLLQQWTAAVLT